MSEPDDFAAALARTLERAASAAPPPAPDLVRRVNDRYHRRHGTLLALAAALAVLIVLVAAVGAARTLNRAAPVTKHPDPTSLGEIGWVRQLPEKVAGQPYQIVGKLPDGRFLASSTAITGTVQSEWLLLLTVPRSGAVTGQVLATVHADQSKLEQISDATGNEHWIAWTVSTPAGTKVYTMPTAPGGKAKAVLDVGKGGLQLLELGGERLYYAGFSGQGGGDSLVSMPAGGGPSSPVRAAANDINAANAHILWPWYIPVPHLAKPEGQPGAFTDYRAVNLVTGEVRTAKFSGTYGADFCTPLWCETGGIAINSKAVVVRRADASAAAQTFPAVKIQQRETGWSVFLRERYLPGVRTTANGSTLILMDAKTGHTLPVAPAGIISYQNGPDYLTWTVYPKSGSPGTPYVFVPDE